ncbi:MAG: hypothetical protein ACLVJO_09345 [[Clostridium] scindens]
MREVIGEGQCNKDQEELTKVMASLPDVDAVITTAAAMPSAR